MTYSKECKICGKKFESNSRNSVYCSEVCTKRGAKRAYRSRKMKHIRSKEYSTDKEISQLLNRAHTLSRDLAKAFLPYVCSCTDKDHICNGPLECHHINHNPCDCSISNLRWLCKKAHAELHSREEDCDVLSELKAYLTIKNQSDIRERNEQSQLKENKAN